MSRLIFTLALLLPATAVAGDDLDAALARMLATTGSPYLEARARAVAHGASALRARLSDASWSATAWELDAMAAIALAWAERPEDCARVYALEGLQPSIYLRRRRPEPEVGRELRRLRDMGPVFFEALVKSLHPLSSRADFPEHLRQRAGELIAVERAALRVGLLAALGRSGHPVARWALARVAADASTPDGERRAAAIALGEAGGDITVLTTLAAEPGLSPWLRGGAVIGVAKATRRWPRAGVDALRGFLADPALRRAAISGLAIAGSSWGAARPELRRDIARLLASELREHPSDRALREALSVTR